MEACTDADGVSLYGLFEIICSLALVLIKLCVALYALLGAVLVTELVVPPQSG